MICSSAASAYAIVTSGCGFVYPFFDPSLPLPPLFPFSLFVFFMRWLL